MALVIGLPGMFSLWTFGSTLLFWGCLRLELWQPVREEVFL